MCNYQNQPYTVIGENEYECHHCHQRFSAVEMPCGVAGPGCRDREEVYCPWCHTFMFSRMIAGMYGVERIE